MKLDNNALEIIGKNARKGVSLDKTAKQLNDLGYRSARGLLLNPAIISRFSCDNGVRKKAKFKKKPGYKVTRKATVQELSLLDRVLESTKLTKDQKLKILENIL